MPVDTVSITLPALPEYVQTVRLVAAGLASRLRFTIDEIEDLKIGVDELCAYLTGPHGRPGVLKIRFEVGDDYIAVAGSAELDEPGGLRTSLTQLSQQILDTVANEARLEVTDGRPRFFLKKVKGIDAPTVARSPS